MKRLSQIVILLIIILLANGCGKLSSQSWAYEKMISLNGINYVVTSEEIKKVDSELGEIKHYSTNEQNANSESFSNYFKVGTKLYIISNISTKDAIAVEINKDKFYKATNENLLNK